MSKNKQTEVSPLHGFTLFKLVMVACITSVGLGACIHETIEPHDISTGVPVIKRPF